MSEAKLLAATEERRKRTRYGRRLIDFLVDVDNAIKWVTKIVATLLVLFSAAIGAGMVLEVKLQDWKIQHAKFKTPPAFEQKKDSK